MKTPTLLDYHDFGNGPTVVLLHDVLLTTDSWRNQVSCLLQEGFRVIVPNLSGLDGVGSVSTYSAAVITLLNRLGIGRFAVCGHGMGGSILLALLERYQRRITGACFISTRPGNDDIHEKYQREQIIASLVAENDLSVREELLTTLMGGREECFDESVRLMIREAAYDYTKDGLLYNLQAMQGRKNYVNILDNLDLPVLIVAGKDDLICHFGNAKIMANRISNCVGVINLDGGHLIQMEKSDQVNLQLVEFLLSIEPPCRKVQPCCSLRAA